MEQIRQQLLADGPHYSPSSVIPTHKDLLCSLASVDIPHHPAVMQTLPILIAIVVYFGLVVLKRLTKKRLNLPPGPSALPILGSVLHLTLEFQEKLFFKWRHTYGAAL